MGTGSPYTLGRAQLNGNMPSFAHTLMSRKESLYVPQQPSILLERFESGNGFTKGSLGTLTQDSTDFVTGTQSIKITTDGAGGVVQVTKTYGSPVDISGSYLQIRAKISSYAHLGELSLYISNDAGFTNWSILDIGAANDGQSLHFFEDGVWINMMVDLGMAQTGGGSFNPASLLTIRIRAADQGGQAINVWVDEISAVKRMAKGIVVITADDGWAVQDTQMRQYLDKYGFRPTLYIIPDAVGTTNYLKLTDIQRLQRINRWEMALHHQTNLVDMEAANGINFVEREIQAGKIFALENGFNGSDHFALPNGAFDSNILSLMRDYYKTSAAIIFGKNSTVPYLEQSPFPDPHKIRRFDVRSNHSAATINALIDRVATQQSVGIFNWHKIVTTTPADITEYLNTNFQTIIDHLATKNVLVMTIGELYAFMRGNIS